MTRIHSLNLSPDDFDKLVSSPDWRTRAEVARRTSQDQLLDQLVHDPDWRVRAAVAFSGKEKYLAQLESDENEAVRAEVARQRQFLRHERELQAVDAGLAGDDATLDRLVKDPSEDVRVMVAKAARPQDLDRLVSDSSALVRAAVARYGRPEDRQKLLADPSPLVRAQAMRGAHGRRGQSRDR